VKRSDIPDDHVLELARAWQQAPWRQPGVVAALVAEGIPVKLARAKVLHMVSRDLMDYGVSEDFAWPG
jgi:hypothetical protein